MATPFRALGILAARAADDKKAHEVELRKVDAVTSLAEFVLVASAPSRPQMEAVADEIRTRLREAGYLPAHRDGSHSEQWRVLDYGGLLVHLMHPRARDFYSVDKLYREGTKVAWKARASRPAAKLKKK